MLLFLVRDMSSFVQEIEKLDLHSQVNPQSCPAVGLFCCFEYQLKGF